MTNAAPVNWRIPNSAGSTKGLSERRQRQTNNARRTTATAELRPMPGEFQPQSFTLTIANVSAAIPPVTSTASKGFGRGASCPGISGSFHQPIAIATRPTGTLTRNIQRQFAVTSRPPMTGPSAAARPPIAVTSAPRRRADWAKYRQQQTQRGRRHQRRAGGLNDAKRDQGFDIDGGGAGRRCDGKQRHPEQEAQVPAVALGEAAEEHQQRRVGDRIAVQDPGHVLERGALKSRPILGSATLTMKRSRLARQMPTQTIASTREGDDAEAGGAA